MAQVTIQDSSGKDMSGFTANTDESVGVQAQDSGAPIPFSCGVGACRTCVCKVKKGQQYIDPEAVGPMMINVDDDEILSCISGVREDAPEDAEIILQADNL